MRKKEGLYEKVRAAAIKRVVARQVEAAIHQKGLTKVENGAAHAHQPCRPRQTSRSKNDALTPEHSQKAAAVVGRQVRLELV